MKIAINWGIPHLSRQIVMIPDSEITWNQSEIRNDYIIVYNCVGSFFILTIIPPTYGFVWKCGTRPVKYAWNPWCFSSFFTSIPTETVTPWSPWSCTLSNRPMCSQGVPQVTHPPRTTLRRKSPKANGDGATRLVESATKSATNSLIWKDLDRFGK